MTMLQQENVILVQHSIKSYFIFSPSKEYLVGYHKWKNHRKNVLRYADY